MNDPLDILFYDDVPHPDPELLASILRGRVRLRRDSERVIFLAPCRNYSLRLQLLIYLLARKALCEMGIADEAISPKDITRATGITGNSVRPNLCSLKDTGLVKQDGEGAYYVPNSMLSRIAGMLSIADGTTEGEAKA